MDELIDLKIASLHEKAKTLLLEKKNESEIISELMRDGIERGYAELILENVKTEISDRKNFWIELFKGTAVTVAGLVLNYLSYTAYLNFGASYWMVYWGIVVFGICIIIRAFIIFRK